MNNEQQMREAFERHYFSYGYTAPLERIGYNYQGDLAQAEWVGFQAAWQHREAEVQRLRKDLLACQLNLKSVLKWEDKSIQRLVDDGLHGCQTGDCPHDKQSECDEALAPYLKNEG